MPGQSPAKTLHPAIFVNEISLEWCKFSRHHDTTKSGQKSSNAIVVYEVIRMENSNSTSFSIPQRILHWLTAALVFFNLLLPDGMSEWKHSVRRTGSATPDQIASANIHAYVGIAILLLVVIRLVLRFTTGVPAAPPNEPAIFRIAAKLAHVALYLLLLTMPLTGIGAYYFGNGTAGNIHADVLKVLLWVLLSAHVAGVLVHQFYWKTNVLRRMTIG
jgi:cytochrome b561